MVGNGGTIDIKNLLAEFQKALTEEISELKKGYTGQRFLAQNGKLLGHYSGRFLYQFYIEDNDLTIPDDSPARAVIKTEELTVHIVSVGPNEITLAFDKDFGTYIPQAIIHITPWFLLEQLRTRLEDIQTGKLSFNFQNALKLFGFTKSGFTNERIVPEMVAKGDLNDRQVEAVLKSLSQEVTFIWGPPGTGKTKTIATIISTFISVNKVVLLTAHTNAAVDEVMVKLAKTLSNKALLSEGRIVRYGTPSRDDEDLKKMVFDEIVARKRNELIKIKSELEEKVRALYSRIASLRKLIELNRTLDQVKQESLVLQEDSKRIQSLLSTIREQLHDIKRNLKQLEEELEEAKKAGFLTRLFLGLNPKRIGLKVTEEREKEQRLLEQETKLLRDYEELEKRKVSNQENFNELSKKIEELSCQTGLRSNSEARTMIEELEVKLHHLKQEISSVQNQIDNLPQEIINNCYVLGVTLSKLYLDPLLYLRNYAVLVLDEASMAPLPSVFFAAGLIKENFVVTGDFRQLPPIAIAKSSTVEKWLKKDIFEQAGIVDQYSKGSTDERLVKLTKQHRMHPKIVEIVNTKMYGGELETSDETTATTTKIAANEPFSGFPVVICDTSQINPWCSRPSVLKNSRFNVYQAVLCCRIAEHAVKAGVKSVGIITPYAAQARLISKLLKDTGLMENVQAATVHRFQGGEKDMIIFDLVDGPLLHPGKLLQGSFPEKEQSASEASKLINVAVTRAKGKFVIVANYSYFKQKLNETNAAFFVLNFAYHNGKIVDSRDILPSYFDELSLEHKPVSQPLHEPEEWEVWNENHFYHHFVKDLQQAKENVVIFSPFLTRKRIDGLMDIFRFLIDKGVSLYVVTKPAIEQSNKGEIGSLQKYLKQAGVKLICRKKLHEKAAFIDDRVCWLGSLNILSHSESSEFMLSIRTKESISQLRQFFGLEKIINAEERNIKKHSWWENLQNQILELMHKSKCSICGSPLVLRAGKYELFLGCQQYYKTGCRGLVHIPREIIEDAVAMLKIECPQCKNGFMLYRSSSKGQFLGCEKFPDCHCTIDLKA